MAHHLNSNQKVWIIEDDSGAQFVYRDILGLRYHLEFFKTLDEFRRKSIETSQPPDLIVADLSLPDGNFFEVLSENKSAHLIECPFIIVSSMDDLDVLRACFDEGALDYLIKPFTKSEIIVKIERILTQRPAKKTNARRENLVLEAEALKLRRGPGLEVQLTVKEVQIFSLLHQQPGRAVPKSKLQSTVWGNISVSDKTLDVHLFNLRKKLSKLDLEIKYVPQEGYTLILEKQPLLDSFH
jgi:DNA-binding response OmpR family regulator